MLSCIYTLRGSFSLIRILCIKYCKLSLSFWNGTVWSLSKYMSFLLNMLPIRKMVLLFLLSNSDSQINKEVYLKIAALIIKTKNLTNIFSTDIKRNPHPRYSHILKFNRKLKINKKIMVEMPFVNYKTFCITSMAKRTTN